MGRISRAMIYACVGPVAARTAPVAGFGPAIGRGVETQIRAKKRELANKLITVTPVDSAMGGLTDRERFIIQACSGDTKLVL